MAIVTTLPIMTNERKRHSVIGSKIQALRKAKGLSQGDLAATIGRQQSRVAKWEIGQGKPEPHDLLHISESLGVSLRFLCDDSMTEPNKDGADGPAPELTRDERILQDLAERYGAGAIVDAFLGVGGHKGTAEPSGPFRAVAVHKRPNSPVEPE